MTCLMEEQTDHSSFMAPASRSRLASDRARSSPSEDSHGQGTRNISEAHGQPAAIYYGSRTPVEEKATPRWAVTCSRPLAAHWHCCSASDLSKVYVTSARKGEG